MHLIFWNDIKVLNFTDLTGGSKGRPQMAGETL